jgi:hypothetical protein
LRLRVDVRYEPHRRKSRSPRRDEIRRGASREWKVEDTRTRQITRRNPGNYQDDAGADDAAQCFVGDNGGMSHRETCCCKNQGENRRRPAGRKLRVTERFFARLEPRITEEPGAEFTRR